MPSPARAFAWQFKRALLPLLVFLAYLVVIGLARPWVAGDRDVKFGDGLAATILVPTSLLFFYLLATFSFGTTGDLGARQSIYPVRMFTLPVTSAALAGWPMLYGAAAMVPVFLAAIVTARTFWGIELPLVWPIVLGAVFLAWTQALMWMPYGLRGTRVVAAVAWLMTLDAIVIAAIELELSESAMLTFLLPQLPLAYLTAWWAVARARRGELPDWRVFRRERRQRTRGRFAGPAGAQAWLEWRRGGGSLPVMVAFVMPFAAGNLFIPGNDTAPVVFATIAVMLIAPPIMAGFASGMNSRPNPHATDPLALSPLDATRPVTTAALVGAKVRVTLASTVIAWLLVAVTIPGALALSETWPIVAERWRAFVDFAGAPRASASLLLGLLLLMASTWKKLVQRLYIGLTGRHWIIKSYGYAALVMLVAVWPAIGWLRTNPDARVWLWEHWPVIAAVLASIKTALAAWVATRLYQTRLVDERVLLYGALAWVVVVSAVYGTLVWMVDTPYVPRYVLALLAILAVPLARLSAAPLALASNRHR